MKDLEKLELKLKNKEIELLNKEIELKDRELRIKDKELALNIPCSPCNPYITWYPCEITCKTTTTNKT